MTELYDFARTATTSGRRVLRAEHDIECAFDAFPHANLILTTRALRLEPRKTRYLVNWLARRRFRLELGATTGVYYSVSYDITRGSPEGGVFFGFAFCVLTRCLIGSLRCVWRGSLTAWVHPE